jgi:hypothetical protein
MIFSNLLYGGLNRTFQMIICSIDTRSSFCRYYYVVSLYRSNQMVILTILLHNNFYHDYYMVDCATVTMVIYTTVTMVDCDTVTMVIYAVVTKLWLFVPIVTRTYYRQKDRRTDRQTDRQTQVNLSF